MNAPAEAMAAAPKVRRPRGPSKKTRAALAEAREQGFNEGLNRAAADRPSGLLLLLLAASFASGFALSNWLA